MRGFTQIVLFSVILSVVAGLDTFIADSVFEVGEGWTHGNYDEVCCFSAENDCYGLPQSQYGTCIALLGGYDGPVSGAMTNSFYLPDNNKNFHNYTLEFEALGIGSGKINVSVNGDVFTLESYADTPTVYSALITDSVILGQINQISFSYSFAASEFLIVNLVNVYTMELVEPTNILQNGHFEGVSHWTTTANNIFCAPTFQYPYDGNCSAVFGDAIPENSIVTQSLFVPKVTAGSEVWAKWRYAVIGENFPGNFTFNIGSITYDLLSNEPGRFSYIWWVTTFNITSMADGTYHDIFWHFDGPADFNIFLDDAYVNVFGSIDNTTTSTTGGSTTSGGSTTGPAPVKQIVVDPSFEQMNPPLPWTQVRTYNDRPLICCDFDCGNTEVLNVVDGSCAVWFGFRPDQTVESVYQDLVIPTLNSGSASVSFHIYVGPGGGFFSVKLDNTELRRYNQSTTSYQQQTIDVTSYADGQSHKLEFHFESDDGKQMFLDLAQLSGDFVVDTTTTGAVITGATATTGSFVTTTAATTGHIVSTTGHIVSTTGTTGGGSPTGSVTSTGETVSTTEGDDDNNGTTTFVGSLNSSAWTVQSSILFCLACIVFAMF